MPFSPENNWSNQDWETIVQNNCSNRLDQLDNVHTKFSKLAGLL